MEKVWKIIRKKAISASQKDEYFYNYQDAIANLTNAEAALTNAKNSVWIYTN